MDRWLRRATPLVLLILAGLVWFERWLPGHEALAAQLGEDAVLRLVVGLLCLYVLMLVVERQRMARRFTDVLRAFLDFRAHRGAGAESAAPQARHEAVEILIGALGSPDPKVRASAAGHLQRLTGQILGEDPEAWRAWLAARPNSS